MSQLSVVKNLWMSFVERQVAKTASDPRARVKLMAMVAILIIITYKIPKVESSFIGCGPCVTWAARFCTEAIAGGGACAAVAAFPPALCACLLSAGGLGCVAAAGTCVFVCLAPTP